MKTLLGLIFCLAAFIPLACTNKITIPTPASTPTPTFTPTATAVPSWQAVGNVDFSTGGADFIQMSISNNGTPYVAYSDYANNESLCVESFNGTKWVPVGSLDFAASAYYTSLWVYNNTPYVAFDPGGSTGISLMTFNGAAWVPLSSPNFAAGFGPSVSGNNGKLYVAYGDASGFAMVMDYTAGAWATVGNADFSPGITSQIVLDATGSTPYVGFIDDNDGQMATVMKLNGATWGLVGSEGFSAGILDGNTHMLVANGTPYFSYTDQYNSTGATVQEFNGSSWGVVGTAGIPGSTTNLTAIAVGNGTPYLAIDNVATGADEVLEYTAGAWTTFGNENFAAISSKYGALATNAGGNPYFAFVDYSGSNSGNICVYEYH